MSREEKEKLLNEKMENIKKRNEELRKRHEEIEADKKNADKISSTVTMDKVKPYVMKTPRIRPEKAEKVRETAEQPSHPRPSDIMPARQRLSESDGPPPDPSYRFLSDPDRDGNDRERKREGRGKRKGKQGFRGGACDKQEDGRSVDGEEDKLDVSQDVTSSECGSVDHENAKCDTSSGEQKSGWGRGRRRGRGRGMGYERDFQEQECGHPEEGLINSPRDGNDGGRRGRGQQRFACRDIRYYPDEGEYQRVGRDQRIRGRGRQNFNQWNYSEEGQHKGYRQGNFEQRGRGRGRNRDKQKEYERWKAERAAIDEARLTRGKTDGGNWRREWDNDKMNQGEADESEPVYDPRYPRSKSENFKLADLINLPDKDGPVPQCDKEQDGMQREYRLESARGSREKFVKVDRPQAKKQLQRVDDVKVEEINVPPIPFCGSVETNLEDRGVLTCANETEASEDLPAENTSSTLEVAEDILHNHMDSGKEDNNEDVTDECCDENDEKVDDETDTECQLVDASSLKMIHDESPAGSLMITSDELAPGSLTISGDEFVAESDKVTDDEFVAESIKVTGDQFVAESIKVTGDEFVAESVTVTGDELVNDK